MLVNSAAAPTTLGAIADTDVQTWDETMTVNARATFLLVRHAARMMREDGRIVSISTMNTIRPAARIASYVASKAAIELLTRVAALELGPRRITANVVSPGFTDTDLLRGVTPESALPRLATMSPLGRLGSRETSPTSSRCSPAPTVAGSPGRSSRPTGASPEPAPAIGRAHAQ